MADPACVESYLLGLPAAVWSAAVAVVGTLGAVIATNRGNTRRLKQQLEHDTEEKAKERLVALRRELYLRAVDAIVRGLGYFGTLPEIDLNKPDADAPLRNALAVGAQLQLVTGQGSAEHISQLISEYGELNLKLLPKAFTIRRLQSEAEESDGIDERAELNDQATALRRQYVRDLIPDLKRIGELQALIMVDLRQELGVGGDIEIFSQIMRRQSERAEKALNAFDRTLDGE